jgi:hypothetical protein
VYCPVHSSVASLSSQPNLRRKLWEYSTKCGSGAQGAQDANSQKQFETLKRKYQSVLRSIEQEHVQLQN